jgi:hypothetical protein
MPADSDRPDPADGAVDPVPLDYFAARAPERVRSRGATAWGVVLVVSWVPYLCGVVSAAAAARSYVPSVTTAHVGGSVLLLGAGLVLATAALVRFATWRHWLGATAAAGVVGVQLAMAACLGLA